MFASSQASPVGVFDNSLEVKAEYLALYRNDVKIMYKDGSYLTKHTVCRNWKTSCYLGKYLQLIVNQIKCMKNTVTVVGKVVRFVHVSFGGCLVFKRLQTWLVVPQ